MMAIASSFVKENIISIRPIWSPTIAFPAVPANDTSKYRSNADACPPTKGGHASAVDLRESYRALRMSSTRSFASPKSIWLFVRKNSGFCTPA